MFTQIVIEDTGKVQSRGRGMEGCNGTILDKVAGIITKKVAL